ncbi:MAG: rod shape-determining protein MreC, partial [Clostridia bacterium]|nr:rod shape-determining protein MreC [Clostridia bacterium]
MASQETGTEDGESPVVYATFGETGEDDEKRRKARREHPFLRIAVLIAVTAVLVLCIASYIFARIMPETEALQVPETFIGRIVTPIQSVFSGITETFADYFRTLKLRANIESAYNELVAENERLTYQAMLADELQETLSRYEDMADEVKANANMSPIVCTVIGRSDSNYFSTFTIGKGSNDGIEDYMAVTFDGALVGYTESVQPTRSTVRSIIDSDASIAALIQSSRDQGTVRGTLGVDGKAMCRMYYLPDENLPRPGDTVVTSGVGMSFPKGIPIGTIRESTRGMESNKQYIVIEPLVDFAHLEYVIVLRYKPAAEAIEGRSNGASTDFVPLETARPSPVVPEIAASLFESQATPDPNATPTPTPTPS